MNTADSNIDQEELDKFADISAHWWDPDSEFWPLHRMNPGRLDYVAKCAGPLAGLTILDVGCGGGLLSEGLAQSGAQVTGIDAGSEVLTVARLHAEESGVEVDYRQITVEELAEEQPGGYDVVACMELLEHVPRPDSVVRACGRLLKPGGHVVFSTINRTPQAWLFAIVGAEYVARLLPRGTHDYKRFIRPSEMAGWCRAAALELRDLTGVRFKPLTRSFTLGGPVDINYLAHFQRGD